MRIEREETIHRSSPGGTFSEASYYVDYLR